MPGLIGPDVPIENNFSYRLIQSIFPVGTSSWVDFRDVLPITTEVSIGDGKVEKFRCVLLEDGTIQCSNGKGIKYFMY